MRMTIQRWLAAAATAKEFEELSDRIKDDLESAEGLHGYSLRQAVFANRAWTCTIWENASSVVQFKTRGAPLDAMRAAPSLLRQATFARAEITAQELPFSWSRALALLETGGRSYRF